MKYDASDERWANPPQPVAAAEQAPAFDHSMVSEEYEHDKKKNPAPKQGISFSQALLASGHEKSDGKIKLTASSFMEVGSYAVFLIVLVYVAFAQNSIQSYYYTKVMSDLFVSASGANGAPAFGSCTSMDNIWDWFSQVLIPGIYWTENSNSTDNENMIYYENRLLGEPRIRMLRVTNDSCTVMKSFQREIKECFANYEEKYEDKTNVADGSVDAYIYATSKELENFDTVGTISTYGGGGFVQRLPVSGSTEAQSAIATLKANRWIDRGTRAIVVDFALYNANINLFCVVKLLFELPASGGVITTPKIMTYNLMTYQASSGTRMIVFEGIFCGFILFFIFEELFAIARHRLHYLTQFWNLVDVALLGFSVATIILSMKRTKTATNRVNSVIENGLTNAPFDDVTSAENAYLNIKACAIFIAWVKVFKFISVNKTMSQLSSTLTRSAKDIGGFAVMFAVFFFAFAQFGYLCFGTQIADYSNLYNSAFALLRLILGDFNFSALENCNRFFGPAFFVAYVFFVSFILLNMFLAIINDSYVEVKAELARKKDGEGILDWFMNKVRGLTKRGKRPDAPGEDATYEDYKIMLYRAGYAEKDINEAFTRFNVTTMTEHIPEKMAEDIADEVARVTEQKRNYMENHRDYANLNRRVDQMQESVFSIVDRIENVNVTLQTIEKQRIQQQDGGNLMDLSALLTSQVRNRESARRQTITSIADKKEDLNRRVDQMQESVFSIVDRIENVNATLQTIEKQRIQQQDGGNLMDLSALLTSQVRNRESARRQTITSIADKKEE
ncbi:hypothetical protein GCK72_012684 [Caenorhabditis remanei]|uniref:Uncharacterized protein n=1 Tax=Caenorhabditis remanei TaxID=31234 RepID=A0A6A5GNK6_CAERE|nr:hypothetical protein GCK72_012684 [Caenorhabditis remanei]KAF1756231.1 hypothetical protein GCK72_012684 [Caenorhabditis remanei]